MNMKLVIISVISFFLLSGISIAGDSSSHRKKYNYERRAPKYNYERRSPKYNYQRYGNRNGHCNRRFRRRRSDQIHRSSRTKWKNGY